MVILASMNEIEEGAGPIQPSLLRRFHKWRFSVTCDDADCLPEFSGKGLLPIIVKNRGGNGPLAIEVNNFLEEIFQISKMTYHKF